MTEDEATKANEFAERLKTLRMNKGLSQKKFAQQIGINYTQYNKYEQGETIPYTESLIRLAEALAVSVDYLLEGKEEDAAVANLKDKVLLELFQEVENFPDKKKEVVKILLSEMVENQRHQDAIKSRYANAS